MELTDVERLRSIKSFPSLVKYLRDDLGWPVDSDDFDELTYDYEPAELGLDAKAAVKIKEIKQLRPLTTDQPFGIFFINFDPKRLPVVVLRRILRALVLKKRTSADRASQAAWKQNDLLFISSYGETHDRAISFAHFREDEYQPGDLPTLRVLGWDGRDTVLHLDHAHKTLQQKLKWPKDEKDADSWRRGWSSAFTNRHREVITTSKALATRLAELARDIRNRVNAVLEVESDKGPIRKLHTAFKQALIHDLTEDDFADMYAQTIAYGLLTARVSRPAGLVAENIIDMTPVTNPFLQELLETFLHVGGRKRKKNAAVDFDELGVTEVVEVLRHANMEAILRDFGDRNPQEDPVIHFYEDFLKEYDSKKRTSRGVFYTPRPVVSFIVRSVHELLQTEFGLEDGLADTTTWGEMAARNPDLKIPDGARPDDPFVCILDPATGTATFLVEVIEVIYRTLRDKWMAQGKGIEQVRELWNAYVPKHLLPRLYGYELMMAPYAIAHMKIGLILSATGYRFASKERVRVYLTNALEPAQDFSDRFEFDVPALAHEAQAVNDVKRRQRFTVVIGNPPYSLMSANLGETQRFLIEPYRFVDGTKIKERGALQLEKNLQDDYVKFIRLGQSQCEAVPLSVLCMVTNHSYVENPTLRGMRRSLMSTFHSIKVLDLHGNSKRKEVCPLPEQDQNAFDIQQGVAIGVFAKGCGSSSFGVHYGELWGSRENKYRTLQSKSIQSLSSTAIYPNSPLYLFVAQDEKIKKEFDSGFSLDGIFSLYSTGIATARDSLTIHFNVAELRSVVETLPHLSAEEARSQFSLGPDTNDWKIELAQRDLIKTEISEKYTASILYRPFDCRSTYYTGQPRGFLCNPRRPVMQHLLAGKNMALCVAKAVEGGRGFSHVFVTKTLSDHHCVSLKEVNYILPLFAYPLEGMQHDAQTRLWEQANVSGPARPNANFTNDFLTILTQNLNARIKLDAEDTSEAVNARHIFGFIYAILFSKSYRTRYAEFLKKEFARIPFTSSFDLFCTLSRLGGELVALHLVEVPIQLAVSARYDKSVAAWHYDVAKGSRLPFALTFKGSAEPIIEKVTWSRDTVWYDKKQTQGFCGVRDDVWNFQIGGYHVCEKWLKDRKGRVLTAEDIAHYHRIIIALHETIRIMKEIDEVIDQHGGWPGAFVTGAKDE